MKYLLSFLVAFVSILPNNKLFSQTTLDTAVNFHVKTIDGEPIFLFDLLDNENKIVVIDFFSTSCGPCQMYAPEFQISYEDFGENSSNVYFMSINWGSNNQAVREFDSTYNLTFPSVSGTQGGGNSVFNDYNILSYPTVIVIVPEDHLIVNQEIVPPVHDSINNAVIAAGGILVGLKEKNNTTSELTVFPNPVRDKTTVKFHLQNKSQVSISIFDLLGRAKGSPLQKTYSEGDVSIPIDLSYLKDGIYFVNISYGNITLTRKIIKSNL